jgi:hypothetical protein
MSEDFQTSEQTDALDSALAKAQSEIQKAHKDSVNPHFRSKFADLGSCWEACRDALTKNGISVTQWPTGGAEGVMFMMTRLAKDGQWIRSRSAWPLSKMDCQGVGSALSYARRYTLCAAVGIVADDDDDGHAASKSRPRTTERVDAQGEIRGDPKHPANAPLTRKEVADHVNGESPLYADFAKWLGEQVESKVYPDKEAAKKAAMTYANELNHTGKSLQQCRIPKVFDTIKDRMSGGAKKPAGNVLGVKQPASTTY